MEENNILSKGVYILYEIKDDLVRNNELKSRAAKLQDDEKRYTKHLESTRKNEASEINTTISKRRAEIEASFSSQLGKMRSNLKKEQSKRLSAKNSKVTKRIEAETEDLREEIRVNKEEISSIFSRNGITGLLNNNYCFALFMPNSLGEFGIIGLTLLVILVVPMLINVLFLSGSAHPAVMVLMYMAFLGIAVGLYILIRKKVYLVHKRELKEALRYRNKIKALKRRIAKKEQNIRKDSDESGYELGEYDDKIASIQMQIDGIVEEKKNAMTLFENQTKRDITDEIHSRYAVEIDEDQNLLETTLNEKHQVDSELSELTVKISKNYESYLGREVLDVGVVDALIEIIDNEEAETVAEAIEVYKKTVDKGLQTI